MAKIAARCSQTALAKPPEFFQQTHSASSLDGAGEAKRGTNDPGYYSYTLGKLEILQLRADAHKQQGKNFNLTKFHDAFMNAGLVPVSIIRREMGIKCSAL